LLIIGTLMMQAAFFSFVCFKVTEAGGDYMIYKYSNIKLNGALPTFEIKMPKDVHINKL
jgi:outer membrane lipoprotein-sorting protein